MDDRIAIEAVIGALREVLDDAELRDDEEVWDVDTINRWIDQLPEKEKLVIVLYYYENLTLREIGEILDVSESRVCQIHTKVVTRLRAHLMRKAGHITLEA